MIFPAVVVLISVLVAIQVGIFDVAILPPGRHSNLNIFRLFSIGLLVLISINLLFDDPVGEFVEVNAPRAVSVDVGPRIVGVTHVHTPALEVASRFQKLILRDFRILVIVQLVERAPNLLILTQI